MKTLVSIIIPFYRRLEKLDRAISSALRQTHPHIELILVDDCSGPGFDFDTTPYGNAPIRLLRHEHNLGPGAARNTGLRYAQGEYICFLDSDDYWAPGFLEKLLAALGDNPQAAFAYAYSQEVRLGLPLGLRRKNGYPTSAILPNILDGGRPWGTSSCLWRRTTVARSAPFPELRCWEDYQHDIAAALYTNQVACCPEVLCWIELADENQKIPPVPPAIRRRHQSVALGNIARALAGTELMPAVAPLLRARILKQAASLCRHGQRHDALRLLLATRFTGLLPRRSQAIATAALLGLPATLAAPLISRLAGMPWLPAALREHGPGFSGFTRLPGF